MNVAESTPQQVMRHHAVGYVGAFLLPLWAAVIAVVVVTRIVIAVYNDFDTSVWVSMSGATKVFLGIVGIIITPVIMPWYITNGVTRRHFLTAVAGVIAATATICGVVLMLGFGVEQAAYGMAGIDDVLENFSVFDSVSRASVVFSSFTLLWAAWFASGWLIGAGYYRLGGLFGTLFLAIGLIPIAIAEYLVSIGWSWNPTDVSGPVRVYMSLPGRATGDLEFPYAVAAVVVAIVVAAAMWLSYRILRAVPID